MRTLATPPAAVLDPHTHRPLAGSFEGPLPPVDLRPLAGPLARLFRRKRWIYAAIATDQVFVGLAVVHLGYASKCFAFAWLTGHDGLAVDRSTLAHPGAARVADRSGEGCEAAFAFAGVRARIERRTGESAYAITYESRDLVIDAHLDDRGAPPPIAAIADLGHGRVNATEKRALLPARGEVRIAGRRLGLDGGLGGFDYTHGLLERRTRWRWAYALGHARGGERVAFNVVEGFVGEPECGLWIDDRLYPIGEGRFTYDLAQPLRPWQIRTTCGALDLTFEPSAIHAERENLGLVASTFLQPVGRFRGAVHVPGRPPLDVDALPGVSEHQDVRW